MIPKAIKTIIPTVKKATDIGLRRQDRDETTIFPNLEHLMNPTSGTPTETATIRGITLKFASQINPQTKNETQVRVRSVAMMKNANIVAEATIPTVSANHA